MLTIECGIDKHNSYYEHEVEIERPLQKKNLQDQNMTLGNTWVKPNAPKPIRDLQGIKSDDKTNYPLTQSGQ